MPRARRYRRLDPPPPETPETAALARMGERAREREERTRRRTDEIRRLLRAVDRSTRGAARFIEMGTPTRPVAWTDWATGPDQSMIYDPERQTSYRLQDMPDYVQRFVEASNRAHGFEDARREFRPFAYARPSRRPYGQYDTDRWDFRPLTPIPEERRDEIASMVSRVLPPGHYFVGITLNEALLVYNTTREGTPGERVFPTTRTQEMLDEDVRRAQEQMNEAERRYAERMAQQQALDASLREASTAATLAAASFQAMAPPLSEFRQQVDRLAQAARGRPQQATRPVVQPDPPMWEGRVVGVGAERLVIEAVVRPTERAGVWVVETTAGEFVTVRLGAGNRLRRVDD